MGWWFGSGFGLSSLPIPTRSAFSARDAGPDHGQHSRGALTHGSRATQRIAGCFRFRKGSWLLDPSFRCH
jgi:hypothetical protein